MSPCLWQVRVIVIWEATNRDSCLVIRYTFTVLIQQNFPWWLCLLCSVSPLETTANPVWLLCSIPPSRPATFAAIYSITSSEPLRPDDGLQVIE